MQECSPRGIRVHELSDTSHTFLRDLPCQRGCPTTLLYLHLLRWVRLKHYCSKHITDTHAGRNYKWDAINLWDLQRPLYHPTRNIAPLHCFPLSCLLACLKGSLIPQKYLRHPGLSFSFFWDHSRDSGSEKASSSMKGWEGHRHFIYHTKANSPTVQSFRWHGCSFNLHSFFLLRSDENCSHSASWIQNQVLK